MGFPGYVLAILLVMTQKNHNTVKSYEKLLHQVPFFSVFEKVGIESESPDLLNLSHQTILCVSHELYYIIQGQELLHLHNIT